ncbi:hypothetical protein A3J43_03710 [Candidatus Uhrbacteria bacterium RIFCSPHIGHO2_12_FULL_54_23]|uniref:Phosphatidic acid phosphatase type 2/haloperoxidase domain-containing protein n=1 Tax=Candidatus Uhrbacteria bacterium RIFCSPHIGHO2_12_FULL_54_23 TaxID=1802397 RepID=A0A1F7UM15_9BACT|nr:MAG: hypothetical protein A3J43_03710 [Candidatus Uhrbacteria bacterium RIFCSPHIGHO2_12_FULL_54_23]
MIWFATVRQFDFQLFQQINGWAGRWAWLDAAGIFAAVYVIWLIGLIALVPFVRRAKARESAGEAFPPARRSWFFPSGMPALAPAVLQPDIGHARWTDFLVVVAAPVVAFCARLGVGEWIGRLRPYEHDGVARLLVANLAESSFPSSHAAVSFALAGAVYAVSPLRGALLTVAALVVAWGRVFVGVHYPSDVIGGALLGLISAFVARMFIRFLQVAHQQKSQFQNPNVK